MGTMVPAVLDALVSRFTAAVPSQCEVVDGWQGATEFGKVLTVGLPDMNAQTNGSFNQPAVSVDRSESGFGGDQIETLRVVCSLEVPPGEDSSTPTLVRLEAGAVLDTLRTSLYEWLTGPDLIDNVTGAWLAEDAWFQADMPAGFGVAVLFTVIVVTHI